MYAIRNKKTKKWVYGTDYRVPHRKVRPRKEEVYYFDNQPVFYAHAYVSYSQRTSFDQALTFNYIYQEPIKWHDDQYATLVKRL